MFVVALTGGIGSGKSTAADRFAALGAGIVDSDQISHELTATGSPLLAEIAAKLGDWALGPDGALDRVAVRRAVFADPQARARLEAILHPRIRALTLERLSALATPYAILVIPLLFETGQERLAERVLVVDLPQEQQIDRVRRRSGLPEEEIRRIIASQIARAERLARADDVIDNSRGPDALARQVERLHSLYLEHAATSGTGAIRKAPNSTRSADEF